MVAKVGILVTRGKGWGGEGRGMRGKQGLSPFFLSINMKAERMPGEEVSSCHSPKRRDAVIGRGVSFGASERRGCGVVKNEERLELGGIKKLFLPSRAISSLLPGNEGEDALLRLCLYSRLVISYPTRSALFLSVTVRCGGKLVLTQESWA